MQEQPVETTLYSLADEAPARPHRRTSERYVSLLRVGALTIGDERELCLIKNISAGGLMFRAYSQIAPGTPLSIELKHGEPIAGVARWVQDECVGMTFDDPIDVVSLIAPPADGPRPRMPRIEVGCIAWVRNGAEVYRTRTSNISQGGLGVESAARLDVGTEVIVSLPRFRPLPGTIKWRDNGAYGIGFNRVLQLQELVDWIRGRQQEQLRRAVG